MSEIQSEYDPPNIEKAPNELGAFSGNLKVYTDTNYLKLKINTSGLFKEPFLKT